MTDIRHKVFSGVLWGNAEKFLMQGIQFLLGIIMARLLSPYEYGLIAMLTVFLVISQVFIDGGFSTALIRSKSNTDEDFSTVFYINIGISLLFYVLLFIAAPYIASFYNQPDLCLITRIYTFNLVINSLVAVNKTKLVIAVDFKTQSKISLFSVVISGIVGIICAYQGNGVWALVMQMMLNALLNVLFSFYYVRWYPKRTFSVSSLKRLFAFGSKLLGAKLINSVYAQIYKLVIGKGFSSGQLGLYTQADQLASFAGHNISAVLQNVLLPIMSHLQDNNKELIRIYRKLIKISAFFVFPLIMGMCGIAKPLVEVLLTSKWSGCVIYIQILSFAVIWHSITAVNLNLLFAKGRSDLVLRLEFVKKTIAVAILCISLHWGVIGICTGRVFYNLVAFYLNTYYTNKILGYGLLQQLKDIAPYLLLSIGVAIIGLYLSYVITNTYFAFFTIIIASVFFYIVLSYLLRLYGFQESVAIVRKQFYRH